MEFWHKILDDWFATRYITSSNLHPDWSAVLQLPVVYNCVFQHSLRSKKNFEHLKELGIETVEQFLRKKRHFPQDKIVAAFARACPTHWLTIDVDSITLQQTLFQGVLCQNWTVKQIYNKLVELKYCDIEPVAISNWQAHFPVALDDDSICTTWKQVCCASPQIKDPKLRSFHLSFLNRIYLCNNVISKITPAVSDRCSLCQIEKETYDHLFWSCSNVHNAIVKLKDFLEDYYYMDENTFTACTFLFSQFQKPVIVLIAGSLESAN